MFRAIVIAPVGTYDFRDDYWVAKFPEVGVFAYAGSATAAQERAGRALSLLLQTMPFDDAVARLESAGIQYDIVDVPEPSGGTAWSAPAIIPFDPPSGVGDAAGTLAHA